jgi:hypothetical protein
MKIILEIKDRSNIRDVEALATHLRHIPFVDKSYVQKDNDDVIKKELNEASERFQETLNKT